MTPLPDPADGLTGPDARRRYTRSLFDLIAPRYDAFTRRFSFGMDRGWKRTLAHEVARRLPEDGVVLDVACGTGDLMRAVSREDDPAVRAIGLDQSAEMVRRARARMPGSAFVCGDMSAMPLPDGSADAITAGYALRNAPDLDATLDEIRRVLRPGGLLGTLDFFLPPGPRWRRVYLRYLRHAGRLVGRWWHNDPHAYGYIEASLRRWMTAGELAARLRAHGFDVAATVDYLGGGIALHVARR